MTNATTTARRGSMALFAAAIFLGSFLLFQVQPMVAKAMLPRFGGSYQVWATCMAFFQGTLLVGYAWAHAVTHRFGAGWYSRWHLAVMLLPIIFVPFRLDAMSQGAAGSMLFLDVVLLLTATVAVPFFVLSTGSVLLQSWLANSDLPERANPYVLYSASNLGSLLALLSYPILIEPLMNLRVQSLVWAVGYVALIAFYAGCLPRKERGAARRGEPLFALPGVSVGARWRWVLLSAGPSALLVAVTNVLTFDIAAVPFLWVLPLSIYLLTFVLVFKRQAWTPGWMASAASVSLVVGTALYLLGVMSMAISLVVLLGLYQVLLFVVAMACHGELSRTRPTDESALTGFYVLLSAGGFVGSLGVSLLVPLLSTTLVEVPIALAICGVALGWSGAIKGPREWPRAQAIAWFAMTAIVLGVAYAIVVFAPRVPYSLAWAPLFALAAVWLHTIGKRHFALSGLMIVMVVAWSSVMERWFFQNEVMLRHRNYYGIYRVFERPADETDPDSTMVRVLQHGTTEHGRQHIDPQRTREAMSYYHYTGPVGDVFTRDEFEFENLGFVGLGTGTMATYLEAGQRLTYFEIDPDNLPIAEEHFTYLADARARDVEMRFVFGDGRIRLREEPRGSFDLLVLDAFSSGSIPVHLLTVEALREYLDVVAEDGVILVHISNRVLDLEPLLFAVAEAADAHALANNNAGNVHVDASFTEWVAIARDPNTLAPLQRIGWRDEPIGAARPMRPWTDQYSNLFTLLFSGRN